MHCEDPQTELEFLHFNSMNLNLVCKKKERKELVCFIPLNSSCFGQREEIIKLASLNEEGATGAACFHE